MASTVVGTMFFYWKGKRLQKAACWAKIKEKPNREDHMGIDLKGRNFLTLLDFTPEEITYLLDYSAALKKKKQEGHLGRLLAGKNIVLF